MWRIYSLKIIMCCSIQKKNAKTCIFMCRPSVQYTPHILSWYCDYPVSMYAMHLSVMVAQRGSLKYFFIQWHPDWRCKHWNPVWKKKWHRYFPNTQNHRCFFLPLLTIEGNNTRCQPHAKVEFKQTLPTKHKNYSRFPKMAQLHMKNPWNHKKLHVCFHFVKWSIHTPLKTAQIPTV